MRRAKPAKWRVTKNTGRVVDAFMRMTKSKRRSSGPFLLGCGVAHIRNGSVAALLGPRAGQLGALN